MKIQIKSLKHDLTISLIGLTFGDGQTEIDLN